METIVTESESVVARRWVGLEKEEELQRQKEAFTDVINYLNCGVGFTDVTDFMMSKQTVHLIHPVYVNHTQ